MQDLAVGGAGNNEIAMRKEAPRNSTSSPRRYSSPAKDRRWRLTIRRSCCPKPNANPYTGLLRLFSAILHFGFRPIPTKPPFKSQKAYDLHALLKGITPRNQHQAADFGPALGERCSDASVCARSRGHRVAELYATGRARAGGYRPALVLSPASYNDKTSLLTCCPLTTQIKNKAVRPNPCNVNVLVLAALLLCRVISGLQALKNGYAGGTLDLPAVVSRVLAFDSA